jgi:hypothetical protein
MTKNIIIGILTIGFVSFTYSYFNLKSKESLEIENLEHQLEYERTMHSIDSCEQMKVIQNYESLIQIIQK